MIDIKKIGVNIRRERRQQLLTIEQLAEKAGITDNYMGKIERGEGMPSLETIDSIASALGVSIDSLKGDALRDAEHRLMHCVMEINELSEDAKNRFIDFIKVNIHFFK